MGEITNSSAADFPVMGALATMPTRISSLYQMIEGVLPQVDRLYVFLDGFNSVPEILQNKSKCIPIMISPGDRLHHANRFLAPHLFGAAAIIVIFDDDILYPPNYVRVLREALRQYQYRAVVGIHGNIFWPPHRSYVKDRVTYHFSAALASDTTVHQLGGGTVAFLSTMLQFNPEFWRHPQYNDLCLAAESIKANLPMISLRRGSAWLQPIAEGQPDSVWHSLQRDERLASSLMRRLMRCYFEPNWEADWRDFWTAFETEGVTNTDKFEAAFPPIR
jgi:hypothetical protein